MALLCRHIMARLVGDTDVPQTVEPAPCRDIYTTSLQAWNSASSSYCTPESAASLQRCAATRRLDYFLVQPVHFQLFHTAPAAISTEPAPVDPHRVTLNSSAKVMEGQQDVMTSFYPHGVTSTSSKVMEGQQDRPDVMSSFHFTEEQIECICAVLMQSKDVERLRFFLGRLPPEQLHRDNEQLYKVDGLQP